MSGSLSADPLFSSRRYYLYLCISVVAGAGATLAFAPYNHIWLVFVSQAVIFSLWQQLTPKRAWFSGWLYGVGLQATGISWIYYSLHLHGGTPAPFAIMLVILLACYLGIYTGFTAYVVNRFCPHRPVLRLLLYYPAAWVIFEWLQGIVLTGFSWMQTGYTQIDTALAGYAPLFGSHGVSGLVAITAGALALLFIRFYSLLKSRQAIHLRFILLGLLTIIFIWGLGAVLKTVHWTQPQGKPFRVSIVQGNIPQSLKWQPEMHQPTLNIYHRLTLAQNRNSRLIVWPETAVPDLRSRVRPFLREMKQVMQARGTDLVFGIFTENSKRQLLNSIINVDGAVYNKRHLVPLGEYIPLRFLIDFFRRWVNIPMSNIASGAAHQPLMRLAGVPAGLSICFEDAFSRNIRSTLPQAKFLLNVSNDAWFGRSSEPWQHHDIARMRALESGRYMVRSTNTGVSSIIDPQGRVEQQAPQFQRVVLTGPVQPYSGSTPYVIWGDSLILLLCALPLVFCVVRTTILVDILKKSRKAVRRIGHSW